MDYVYVERFCYLYGEKAVEIAKALNERLPILKKEIYEFITLTITFAPSELYKVFSDDSKDEVHEAVMQLIAEKKFILTEELNIAIA